MTYGPYRPSFATISCPVSGSTPSERPSCGTANSCSATSGVSSSGGRSSGRFARWDTPSRTRSRYGPYRPTRTTTSSNIGIELISRASISSRFTPTSFFSPPARATEPSLPCAPPK